MNQRLGDVGRRVVVAATDRLLLRGGDWEDYRVSRDRSGIAIAVRGNGRGACFLLSDELLLRSDADLLPVVNREVDRALDLIAATPAGRGAAWGRP